MLAVSVDPQPRPVVSAVVDGAVQKQSQAAAGVRVLTVRPRIVRPLEQLTAFSDTSQATTRVTPHGGQTGPAVVRGVKLGYFLELLVREELAVGLGADQADPGLGDRPSKLRGNAHPRFAQPAGETEQRPCLP